MDVLILLDIAALYIAGLLYSPKVFLIPPALLALSIVLIAGVALYIVHLPLLIWARIPYLGRPAKFILGIERALVVTGISMVMYDSIVKEMQQSKGELQDE